jgi:uncharacterized membrane protein
MTIEQLAQLIQEQKRERLARLYSQEQADRETVEIRPGPKYTKIDVGTSGFLMVDNATGEIFGIKGYGRVHPGRRYGTLATIGQWYWGDYYPQQHKEES